VEGVLAQRHEVQQSGIENPRDAARSADRKEFGVSGVRTISFRHEQLACRVSGNRPSVDGESRVSKPETEPNTRVTPSNAIDTRYACAASLTM
jgi:hypothetical protein